MSSQTQSRVRKHLYLVTEHEDENVVGGVKIFDTRLSRSAKNSETPITVLDEENGSFRTAGKQVSMGYVDFDSEEDYEARIGDEMERKLAEIDAKHIEKAGLDPEEYQ